MTSVEYAIVTNKTAMSNALRCLWEVMADESGTWGITTQELQAITKPLAEKCIKMLDDMDLEEEQE